MKDDFYLMKMLLGGHSYSEIAETLGTRREEIARRVTRLRLAGFLDAYDRPVAPRSEPVSPAEMVMKELPFEVKVETRKVQPPKGVKGVHLLDLRASDCRFPVAHEGAHFFCGEPRRDARTSYCAEHHTKVWVNARLAVRARSSRHTSQTGEETRSLALSGSPAHG